MPATSSSKKTSSDSAQSKKVTTTEVTPIRISSRIRKEKFSVKELFSTRDRDVSSDEEVLRATPKKKGTEKVVLGSKGISEKDTKVQVVRASTSRQSVFKSMSETKLGRTPVLAKPLDHKPHSSPKILSSTPRPFISLSGRSSDSATKSQLLRNIKTSVTVPVKTSILKKSSDVSNIGVNKADSKTKLSGQDEEMFESIIDENIQIEPIFNQDNIEAVLENPGSLGLDIVVTKLSDQKEQESKKSKNVVTIAKMTGASSASKPIKVVPMKPATNPLVDSTASASKSFDLKTPGTPAKNSSIIVEKKSKVVSQPTHVTKVLPSQVKEVKVNKSLGSDVVVVTQTLDSKGVVSTKVVEKKRQVKPLETKFYGDKPNQDSEIRHNITVDKQKANKRSLLISERSEYTKVKSTIEDSTYEPESKRSKNTEETQEGSFDDDASRNPYDFEKYFSISESYIRHNESLDSEASNDDDTYLSHFFEKDLANKRRRFSESEDYTIYDLMYQVNCEFPSWNLHVLQDTDSFLICQVTRGSRGLPVMSKMIELDSELSLAKVYINQTFQKELCGSYDTFDSIRQLISSVQQL